eukprot:CAMPEP_0198131164 /NCGR_PEP_ID=MMETSP1442-20131203/55546_1 /TAXON_ID= /ORGANISM="Craspedostauros australis, Strain CCMP3328" /LENGTH=32 /DNA_ID= /DNA_START= /DNA_END= /DNA_ORIENTATION=
MRFDRFAVRALAVLAVSQVPSLFNDRANSLSL